MLPLVARVCWPVSRRADMYSRYLSISIGESSEQGLRILLSFSHCCTASLVGVVTCNAPPSRFGALASPWRVPTTNLPSPYQCLPNQSLTTSSPPQCLPHTSSRAATVPREASLYLFLSPSLLHSSSLNIIPSIGRASSTCILSRPSTRPPTNFPHHSSPLRHPTPRP